MSLIEITPATHGVEIDLAYGGADNFTGKPVYRRPACYLHADAEALLRRAADLAAIQNIGLKIFDAFRPSEAQWILWEHTPDPDFLADPRRGSPHSRGVAIDLTLIDAAGHELEMGTGFDAFTERSHHANKDISAKAQHNRFLLLGIMTSAGWDFYAREWWHYQIFGSRRYPVLGDDAINDRMMR